MQDNYGIKTASIHLAVLKVSTQDTLIEFLLNEIPEAFNKTGVVLIRETGFDTDNFEIFTQQLCHDFHNVGARYSTRQKLGDGYSTEVFRENFTLLAHTEGTFRPLLGYSNGVHKIFPMPPEVCFFMCMTPPAEQGGETTLVDGITFLKNMSPQLRRRFEDSGITYSMLWGPERWKNEFYVEDAHTLAGLFAEIPGVKYSFHKESLELFYTTEAITKTRGGDHAFATGLLAHLPRISHPRYLDKKVHTNPANRVFFGDGEELSDEIINELIDIHDTLAYPHRWQAGDVLMIDNTRFMHGRTMTQRHCDRIIASRFGWLKPDS